VLIKSQTFDQVLDYGNQVNQSPILPYNYGTSGDAADRKIIKHSFSKQLFNDYPVLPGTNPYERVMFGCGLRHPVRFTPYFEDK